MIKPSALDVGHGEIVHVQPQMFQKQLGVERHVSVAEASQDGEELVCGAGLQQGGLVALEQRQPSGEQKLHTLVEQRVPNEQGDLQR